MILIKDEDVERLRTQGWDYIPTNIARDYRPNWTMYHAIREFVQNSLDETESFEMKIVQDGLEIRDEGAGFLAADLLFHYREKPPWARSQFGEGLKIACLVSLRNGYPVHIWTKEKIVRPLLLQKRFSEAGVVHEVAVLYFFWAPFPQTSGIRVLIQNYKGELYLDRFVQKIPTENILFSRDGTIDEHKITEHILNYPPGRGQKPEMNRLYVRDIFVTDFWQPTMFSYNLWGVQLDPDRVAVTDPDAAARNIARLLGKCNNMEVITALVKNIDKGLLLEYIHSIYPQYEVEQSYLKVWTQIYGEKAVLRTNEADAREAEHNGYTVVDAKQATGFLMNLVRTDHQVVEEEKLKERIPVDPNSLSPTRQKNLALMFWLQDQVIALYTVDRGPREKAKIVPYKVLPTTGAYSSGEIKIRQDVLDSERESVEVFVHELAHHTSDGAIDLTDAHVQEMEYITWLLWMIKVKPTGYDLYDALQAQGVIPKFVPRGRRPPKPTAVYIPAPGEIVSIVSGPFQGIIARVQELRIEAGEERAVLKRKDSPTTFAVPLSNLQSYPAKECLFDVNDIVRVIAPGSPLEGKTGKIKSMEVGSVSCGYQVSFVGIYPEEHYLTENQILFISAGTSSPQPSQSMAMYQQPRQPARTLGPGVVRGRVIRNIERAKKAVKGKSS